MSRRWENRGGHWGVAALLGVLMLLGAYEADAFVLNRGVVGNGAPPTGGMSDGARAMQATSGQAIVGQSDDGARTLVHGWWARGGVHVLAVGDGVPKGPGPLRLAIGRPHPNPARPGTSFTITIPEPVSVRLAVFDLQGREVERIVDGRLPAGAHTVRWSASVPPGVYLARLTAGGACVGEQRLIVLH